MNDEIKTILNANGIENFTISVGDGDEYDWEVKCIIYDYFDVTITEVSALGSVLLTIVEKYYDVLLMNRVMFANDKFDDFDSVIKFILMILDKTNY